MTLSPLQFAREFEKLKSDLARLPGPDLRLRRLIEFWGQLETHLKNVAFSTWVKEFTDLLITQTDGADLSDFSLNELAKLRDVLSGLIRVSDDASRDRLTAADRDAAMRLATLYFYAGATDQGLALCAELAGVGDLVLPTESELRGLSPLDALRTVYDKYRRDHAELGNILQTILARWEETALAVEHDRVWCLFVDKDGKGNAATGRMRLLRGAVEQIAGKTKSGSLPGLAGQAGLPAESKVAHHSWWVGKSHPKGRATGGAEPAGPRPGSVDSTDLVAFDNQVKTPDDPFIGAGYDSLKAARRSLRNFGFGHRAQGSLRAFLSIEGNDRTFTGDSIGLAVALVSFTQLLKPEVMRQERFIASDIAVTGGIDAEGRITPVNDETLPAKIERAFFSHVGYVVLPEANLATARDTVKHLDKQYPRRKLRLLSTAHLDDALNDRNIIRSEKVCLGEFVARKAVRYSRLARVQVPFLIGLLAVAFLLYADYCPKCWPQSMWFDWNPQYVRLTERGFEALNKDSAPVWDVEYECEAVHALSKWEVGDLDGDGNNEVAFAPKQLGAEPCDVNANLFVYESDGGERFRRHLAKLGEYPGDTSPHLPYGPAGIRFVDGEDGVMILTAVTKSMPSVTHIRLWSAAGDSLGWYVNSGGTAIDDWHFSDAIDTGFAFTGINNRAACVFLLVLPRDSFFGVSPPYSDTVLNLSSVMRGNQIAYLLFPPSDLCKSYPVQYNGTGGLVVEDKGQVRIGTLESNKSSAGLYYYLNSELRVTHVSPTDLFEPERDALVKAGKPPMPDSIYYANLRDSVKYWTDSGFVTEGQLRKSE